MSSYSNLRTRGSRTGWMLRVGVLSALLAVVASPGAVEAQTRSGGSGHFSLGSMRLDIDALNSLLSTNDLPTVESSALSFGGGGYAVRGRLVLGGEGHGFMLGDETTADGRTGVRVGAGYGVFVAGLELNPNGSLRIQPRLGLGGGGHSIQLGPREIPRLDDVLADPARGVNLSHGGLVRTVGVRIERTFGADGARRSGPRSGPVLGLELGRISGMGTWRWGTEWGEVTRGPSLPLEGSYIRGTIGGGGRR
jgi:hypothetical protein